METDGPALLLRDASRSARNSIQPDRALSTPSRLARTEHDILAEEAPLPCSQCPGFEAQRANMPLQEKNSAQKEKIVAAAAQLFARQGYHGASTREIARLANVSENTIFRHFDCKEDLFWSAVRARCLAIRFRRDLMEGMSDGCGPEVILPKIVEFLSDILNFSPELLRLIAVAFVEMPWKADIFCEECLTPAFSAINKYLAIGVQNGKVRNLDPTMVTAALTAMVLVHPWLSRLIDGGKLSYSDNRDASRAYARFWLDVLSTRVSVFLQPISPAISQGVR